eukprot:gene8211-36_t
MNPSTSQSLPPACLFFGKYTSKCGYCKEYDEKTNTFIKKETSVQIGMNLITFTPEDYEKLYDRGWQRSGTFGYQPQNQETCCAQYGIRLDTSKLVLDKKQKKVMNKWEKFLSGKVDAEKEINEKKQQVSKLYQEITKDLKECIDEILKTEDSKINFKIHISSKKIKNVCDFSTSIGITLSKVLKKQDGKYFGNLISKKFQQKFEKYHQELESIGVSETGHLNFLLKKKDEIKKEIKLKDIQLKIFPTSFKEEEFELYKKYQVKVHRDNLDDLTEEQYKNFLCESPLQYVNNPDWKDSPLNLKFGSFHIQYILDGNLIAVSVVDVLPHGISSKYHFYHPNYSFLSLGVFSVIQECEIVKFHSNFTPSFKYYYLGYYVHNNSKVNYKGNYYPSELLCPVTLNWVPIEKCRKLLDQKKFCQLFPEDEKLPEEKPIVVHHGFTCDVCRKFNFTGNRYHCLDKGTSILMADGSEKNIEDIKLNDEVLGPDSKPRKVINLTNGTDIMYRITQKSNSKKDTVYGQTEFICNSRHLLVVETPRFVSIVKQVKEVRTGILKEYVEYYKLSEINVDTNRKIKMVKLVVASFSHKKWGEKKAKEQAIKFRENIIKENDGEKIFKWLIEARDVDHIHPKVRNATYQIHAPILIENDNFRKKCNELDEKNLFSNDENISKMAWLFGLWIGDGSSIDSRIAVNIKDKDEIKRIQDYSNDLGLCSSKEPYQTPLQIEKKSLTGTIDIHSSKIRMNNNGDESKIKHKKLFNTFWNLIEAYGLGNETTKFVPNDFHLEEIFVREWFLAGLIDSDGCVHQDKVYITTIYEKVSDGVVKISKSLGIRASVSYREAYIDKWKVNHKKAYNVTLSMSSALQNILSKCSITGEYANDGGSKRKYISPPEKVEYLNQPFYFNCEKIQQSVNENKKKNIKNLSDDEIRKLMKEYDNFGLSIRDMEKLSIEINCNTTKTSIACYLNGSYKTSSKSRQIASHLLLINIGEYLRLKIETDLQFEYFGITLSNESDKLFLLANNCIVHNCLDCPDYDLCEDCHKSNSKIEHFEDKHQWKIYDFDVHGSDIYVYYSEKIATLKQFEKSFNLKKETKLKLEEFKKSVGDEMSSKIIYFLRDQDLLTEEENSFENSLVKEKPTVFNAFSGGGRSLKKDEEKVNELIVKDYEYRFDESKPSTSIQFRFHDGSRLVQKFNMDDTISSLYSFVNLQKPLNSFDLMKSHPRMILTEKNQTIKEAGLKGGGIIQIKK